MGRLAWAVTLAAVAALTAPTGCSSSQRAPRAREGVVVRGRALLDGAPFDSRWVGAVVLDHGLVTPCQYSLPPVKEGRYSIRVYAATRSSGCGAPGARIVLWTFADDKILFSTNRVAWPGNGRSASFTARYSTATPAGAAPVTAEFNGGVFGSDGRELPAGTRVDAYVGRTRCGTASVRKGEEFTGYILAVVGPDSIAGCARGAPLRFRIDGRPAAPTSVRNSPPGQRGSLDLRLP